ncbi:MerR family transcriptional regulator [Paenibacillus sp. IB182493]|uniref:MerR family transcriptional regulator n=1 Tax=Paenibacillus arenilitoris TaxID=2772299 RepID=A0A927CPW0_9BACL|nr:MerR family transcriptional regulator [Paenibacillus arenilitoris]
MLYTVKEVSNLSGTTIKTLHHYHKIGLLPPSEISEAGYRLYGTKELERLQHILFYRELDLPLEQIKRLLEGESDRLAVLASQEELLLRRKERLETVIRTLRQSKIYARSGETMNQREMFKGFENEEAWKEALEEHNRHIRENYGHELGNDAIDVPEMNEQAAEAAAFMNGMAEALREGLKHRDDQVRELVHNHLLFLNGHGHALSAADFAAQTEFFLKYKNL